jgi:hypothetical protein
VGAESGNLLSMEWVFTSPQIISSTASGWLSLNHLAPVFADFETKLAAPLLVKQIQKNSS